MQIFKTLLFLIIVGVLSCSGKRAPDMPHPTPIVSGTEFCDTAEDNLLARPGTPMASRQGVGKGCEEGEPTKKGKRFGDFCRETQIHGIAVEPECLSVITSCFEIYQCTHKK